MVYTYNVFRKSYPPLYFEAIIKFQTLNDMKHAAHIEESPSYKKMFLEGEIALGILISVFEKGIKDKAFKSSLVSNDASANHLAIAFWAQMIGIMMTLSRKENYINDYGMSDKSLIETALGIIFDGIIN